MPEITAAGPVPATITGAVSGLVRSLRPKQWTKNSVIFAALIFSKHLGDFGSVTRSAVAFGCFCLISSAVYLINDVFDLANDRLHPTKSRRPIAAGEVPVPLAVAAGLALGAASLVLAFLLRPAFAVIAAVYLASNVLYSAWLKKVVILDVMMISMGFVLRAVAGGLVIEVDVSAWLILCTILLSLFLALCKRRQELALLEEATQHRGILKEYSVAFLDQMVSIVTAATLVAYSAYTLSPEVQHKLGTQNLYMTVPFVIYGIFRYLYLVHKRDMGGSPTEALFSDRPLLANVVLWAVAAGLILYLG
jgi:4-hydroxybenzoate polyprenyltransferase